MCCKNFSWLRMAKVEESPKVLHATMMFPVIGTSVKWAIGVFGRQHQMSQTICTMLLRLSADDVEKSIRKTFSVRDRA